MSREKQIAKYLAAGLTAKQIAEKLNLTHRTIEKYIELMKYKHGAENSAHLVSQFYKKGILKVK